MSCLLTASVSGCNLVPAPPAKIIHFIDALFRKVKKLLDYQFQIFTSFIDELIFDKYFLFLMYKFSKPCQ